jgi:hypothetical protein
LQRHEKNWVFINASNTEIVFARKIDPWHIVRCRWNGSCVTSKGRSVGAMRGGTQFVPVVKDLWLAWGRTHLEGCGCGRGSFYRPHLILARGKAGDLQAVGWGSAFDFGTDVRESGDVCEGLNMIGPTALARWDKTGPVDEMDVTLTLNDGQTLVVRVRGLWKQLSKRVETAPALPARAVRSARKFCARYGALVRAGRRW